MTQAFDIDTRRAIRKAMARDDYENGNVRIVDDSMAGFEWLVPSQQGLFAVAKDRVTTVMHGWFFGVYRRDDLFYLFQNCGMRDLRSAMGRIIRLHLVDGKFTNARVLVTGLHNNCHQLSIIDDQICIIDTANQQILRFTLDGSPVDVKQPFPVAPPNDRSGAYLHINSIAEIDGRIVLMLHNGKVVPEENSQLAWLDSNWNVVERVSIEGRCCHDIVTDEEGTLWHCDSMGGDLISSDGRRIKVTSDLMSRGIAFSRDKVIVGKSTFGPRHLREALRGGVVIFDRRFNPLYDIELKGCPTDIVAL